MKPSGSFPANPDRFVVVDVGSTTTKAVLFENKGAWSFHRAESPTTVEKPYEDVTVGLKRALAALEAASGERLLDGDTPVVPLLATSSAGGGLAIVVAGLVREITAESADRAALGAGAILLDTIAMNDGRTPYRKVEDLKTMRPDMILLAGGFDADNLTGPAFLAELMVEAGLRPKLNPDAKLPLVYAGNVNATEHVHSVLGDGFLFRAVPNIRPNEETENYEPCRTAIHELFMDHVMSQAPGYARLTQIVAAPVTPTPAAFARTLGLLSEKLDTRVLAVDIGGATTDVFTADHGEVFRTVSANIGLSYSILNVCELAGPEAILALLEDPLGPTELWNRIAAKHTHPTSLPATDLDMRIEWATAAVAIREAVRDHFAVLKGRQPKVYTDIDINDLLRERRAGPKVRPPVAIPDFGLIVGSGGILSHSPRAAAARMLVDALSPRPDAELAVDNEFIFPHLGVLAESNPELARTLLAKLGLIKLGRAGAVPRGYPTGYVPPQRPMPEAEPPRKGQATLRRELVIPGTVFVKPGQGVKTDTPVARSTRLFLRPFFLHVAQALEIPPETLPEHMHMHIGDEVRLQDVLASRPRRVGGHKQFHSPIEGRIEKLLPGGVVMVRERPEDAREYTAVEVAHALGVDRDEALRYVKVKKGDEIERGQWVAEVVRPDKIKFVASPVRGKVNRIDKDNGMVVIEPLLEELEVKAWLPGTVDLVSDCGATVTGDCTTIMGVWGRGNESSGLLDFKRVEPGFIHVVGYADAAVIARVEKEKAAGLVCAGMDIVDVLDPDPGFTLVMTEGFGRREFPAETRAALEAHAGKLALIDGRTQLRVGVRRPVVLLPD